ncbi:serine/threonine-protein kinase [Quadrisphaera sp. GCM10027208]|uniref:serine/threonine-protein kinase n=1 Tax=Quadrisphaera sp. GCM10027208 TaxID=3273423 RepID=UPI00361627D8
MTRTEPTGGRLGRYRLVHRIGEGGMGVVHLALDEAGRAVAVKVLRPHVAGDPEARRRLAREVDTLRRVRSPRVAAVLDADVDCDTPYVVTEYVPAPPLDVHVREHGPLDAERLAALGDGLGEALAAVHEAGVVHRDLKPGNVLMLDGEPVVIDFGIAHVADDVRLTSTGLVMGTPGYLSPEVVAGEPVTPATDWWGWAATMAFAATGRPPFGRGPVDVVLDRVRRGDADLEGVPAGLLHVLRRGLEVDPLRRPRPAELRMAVERLREGGPDDEAWDDEAWDDEAWDDDESWDDEARDEHGSWDDGPVGQVEDRTRAVPVPPTAVLEPVARHDVTGPVPAPYQEQTLPGRYPPPGYPPYPLAAPALVVLPRRSGTIAAGLLALVAVAAVAPAVAAIAALLGSALARTVDRAHGALLRRRHERGPRRSDVVRAVAASPWHLVPATGVAVVALVLPLLLGVAVAFLTGWFLGDGGLGLAGVTPGSPVALAAGAASAAVAAWWGPGGAALRRGTRTVVRAVAPGRGGSQVAVVLLLLVTVAAVVVVLGGAQPDWTPLPGPPLGLR